jgi:hypothetical protein
MKALQICKRSNIYMCLATFPDWTACTYTGSGATRDSFRRYRNDPQKYELLSCGQFSGIPGLLILLEARGDSRVLSRCHSISSIQSLASPITSMLKLSLLRFYSLFTHRIETCKLGGCSRAYPTNPIKRTGDSQSPLLLCVDTLLPSPCAERLFAAV